MPMGCVGPPPEPATEDAAATDAAVPAAMHDARAGAAADPNSCEGVSDAAVDAAGDAVDTGSDEASPTSGASVVITGGGTSFPRGTCVAAADSQTFTFSNPGDTPATWTSSVTGSFQASPLAMLVPSSGTVPPGQSVTVTLVFPLVSDPVPATSVEIQIVSGGSTTALQYLVTVMGYVVAAPATVNFGDVPGFADFPSDAVQTANLTVVGVDSNGNLGDSPSPCEVFGLAQSGSSLFSLGQLDLVPCVAAPGGATLGFEFDAPLGTAPGMYQATFAFVSSNLFGPPCHSPPPIEATANLLPPPDAGP
jgi:hypothetical protein